MSFFETLTRLLIFLQTIISLYKKRKTALKLAKKFLAVIDSKLFTGFRIGLCIVGLALTIFMGGLLVPIGMDKGFSLPMSTALGILYATSFMPLAYLTFRDTIRIR